MRLDPETKPAHDLAGQRAAVRIDYGYDDSGNRKAIDDVRILSGTRSLSIGLLLTMAYTGGLGVSNSGLYYAQQRYYDPHLGRWLTPDPIGFSGGLNLYAYPTNPINYADPSGLIELYPEGSGPSAELRAFRKEYRWPSASEEQMRAQIDWENNPTSNGDVVVHFVRRCPGTAYSGRLRGVTAGKPRLGGYPSGRSTYRGYYPPNAPPIFRRNLLPPSSIIGRPSAPGRAPLGKDGHPVEMHHVDQSPNVVDEYTRTDHRLGANYARNHTNTGQSPSCVNRTEWKNQREFIWEADLREGRFNGLP